jgi:hypothetical protein
MGSTVRETILLKCRLVEDILIFFKKYSFSYSGLTGRHRLLVLVSC